MRYYDANNIYAGGPLKFSSGFLRSGPGAILLNIAIGFLKSVYDPLADNPRKQTYH